MHKVGIITFHNAENYGASLQAYALMRTVTNLGYGCEVVDYRNRGVFHRNFMKSVYYFCTFQHPIKNHQAYKQFQNNFMNLTQKTYRRVSAFEQETDKFNVLLFGSDQIWNPDLANGFDPFYFGRFLTGAKKIAYGASFGKDEILLQERRQLNQLISGFDALGVREEAMLQMIDRDAICVVDPCMLLPASDWLQISSSDVVDEGYILVYQLFANKEIMNTAERLAREFHKHVKVISPYLLMQKKGIVHKLGRITPNEFINYYHHAEMVVSDSFHGTLFSIIFEKPFYTILPAEKTGRIISLLNKYCLSNRIVIRGQFPSEKIGYDRVRPLLHQEIENSMDFLRTHLP